MLPVGPPVTIAHMWSSVRDADPAGRGPEVSSASTGLSGTGSREASLSGTIIDGLFTTGYAMGCLGTPDCTAWVAAGCPAHLAGIDPAKHTSIVSVATRAGTSRVFEVRRGTGESILLGGVKVQFWTNGCTELQTSSHSASSTARMVNGIRLGRHWTRETLVIPDSATWMTVSANDNLNIEWTLQ